MGATMIKDAAFPRLVKVMGECNMTPNALAKVIGLDPHTMYRKIRGEIGWKLWEGFAVKEALKTGLTMEELFEQG